MWCGEESNLRHRDFQSLALPTELPHRVKIMVRFPLHLTLYCIFSFTSARQRELISWIRSASRGRSSEKSIILVAYVGFEPMSTIHVSLTTSTRAHDCTVLSKSTLCILKVTIHRNVFLFQ
jgi:2'-5' RNA ligase